MPPGALLSRSRPTDSQGGWVLSLFNIQTIKLEKKKGKGQILSATSNIGKTNICFLFGCSGQLWILVLPHTLGWPFRSRKKSSHLATRIKWREANGCPSVEPHPRVLVWSSWLRGCNLRVFFLPRWMGHWGSGGGERLGAVGFVSFYLCSWHQKKNFFFKA